jgi:hypothetical protein
MFVIDGNGLGPLSGKFVWFFLKSDNQSKANILNEQFKSVFTNENHTNFPDKGPSPFWSIICCYVSFTFFKDGNNPRISPVLGNCSNVEGVPVDLR